METENVTLGSASSVEPVVAEPCRLDKIRDVIADTLHTTAVKLDEKAAAPDTKPSLARYTKRASDWLDNSAVKVREFDGEQTDAKIRDYVSMNPGRSLLMAGAVGLVIGIILRRR